MKKPRHQGLWALATGVLLVACSGTAIQGYGGYQAAPVSQSEFHPVASPARRTEPPEPSVTEAPKPSPTPEVTPMPTPRPTRAPRAVSRAPVSHPAGRYGAATMRAREWAKGVFGSTQWSCLDMLVWRESRWSVYAKNKTSGAYGLGQALPGSKMARFGADWRTSPFTQLRWMLSYVRSRYGTACEALAHSYRTGWY